MDISKWELEHYNNVWWIMHRNCGIFLLSYLDRYCYRCKETIPEFIKLQLRLMNDV